TSVVRHRRRSRKGTHRRCTAGLRWTGVRTTWGCGPARHSPLDTRIENQGLEDRQEPLSIATGQELVVICSGFRHWRDLANRASIQVIYIQCVALVCRLLSVRRGNVVKVQPSASASVVFFLPIGRLARLNCRIPTREVAPAGGALVSVLDRRPEGRALKTGGVARIPTDGGVDRGLARKRLRSAATVLLVHSLVVCLLVVVSLLKVSAQSASTGALSGTVTDPTSAVVQYARIALRNKGTGEIRTATT